MIVMRKRNDLVVLSSDGEDDDCSVSYSNRSYSKPKSRSLITRSNPRGAKKARLSGSRSHLSKESSNADEVCFNFCLA